MLSSRAEMSSYPSLPGAPPGRVRARPASGPGMLGRGSDDTEIPAKCEKPAPLHPGVYRSGATPVSGGGSRATLRPPRRAEDPGERGEHDDRVRHRRRRRRRLSATTRRRPCWRARPRSSAGDGSAPRTARRVGPPAAPRRDRGIGSCGPRRRRLRRSGSFPGSVPPAAGERERAPDVLVGVRVLEHVVRERPERGPVAGERIDVVDAAAAVPVADHPLRARVERPPPRRGDGASRKRRRRRRRRCARRGAAAGSPFRGTLTPGTCGETLGRLRRGRWTALAARLRATAQVAGAARREEEKREPAEDEQRDRDGRRARRVDRRGDGPPLRSIGSPGSPGLPGPARRRSSPVAGLGRPSARVRLVLAGELERAEDVLLRVRVVEHVDRRERIASW